MKNRSRPLWAAIADLIGLLVYAKLVSDILDGTEYMATYPDSWSFAGILMDPLVFIKLFTLNTGGFLILCAIIRFLIIDHPLTKSRAMAFVTSCYFFPVFCCMAIKSWAMMCGVLVSAVLSYLIFCSKKVTITQTEASPPRP